MRKCDSCGKLYQENKDVFCPHCGAVAQKQCTHSSSFDSGRYDRGEIYKNNNTQYQNTAYKQGFEPHAQRDTTPYKETENTFEGNGDFGDKIPKINIPDIAKKLSGGKNNKGKFIGIIVVCIVFAFNMIINNIEDTDFLSDYETVTEYDGNVNELYTVVDKATIKVADIDGDSPSFTLEIGGMSFDDSLPENMKDNILSGEMSLEILSEDTFVEMLICDFSETIVAEDNYNKAIEDAYYCSGKQVEGECEYEFFYEFDYNEIVHIGSGVSFYLYNGMYINAELPFSAFSVSEDGIITYYSSYANDETAWNTVFTECSNEQHTIADVYIGFDAGE